MEGRLGQNARDTGIYGRGKEEKPAEKSGKEPPLPPRAGGRPAAGGGRESQEVGVVSKTRKD